MKVDHLLFNVSRATMKAYYSAFSYAAQGHVVLIKTLNEDILLSKKAGAFRVIRGSN